VTAQLPARLIVTALIRSVQAQGGFATVLRSGHDQAGSIMLQCTKMGQFERLLERQMTLDGAYEWRAIPEAQEKNALELNDYMERRHARDRDLWVIELDVADTERFIAELNAFG